MINNVMEESQKAFNKELQHGVFLNTRIPLNIEVGDIKKLLVNRELLSPLNDSS